LCGGAADVVVAGALAARRRPLLGCIAAEAVVLALATAAGRVEELKTAAGRGAEVRALAATAHDVLNVQGIDFGAVNGRIADALAQRHVEDLARRTEVGRACQCLSRRRKDKIACEKRVLTQLLLEASAANSPKISKTATESVLFISNFQAILMEAGSSSTYTRIDLHCDWLDVTVSV
jgi:hypothetical protein